MTIDPPKPRYNSQGQRIRSNREWRERADKALEAMRELKREVERLGYLIKENRISSRDFYEFENRLYDYNNQIKELETT